MKKLVLILPLFMFNAYADEPVVVDENVAVEEAVAEDVPAEVVEDVTLISGCEQITTDREGGDVYKCPMSEEFDSIQAMEANVMFGGSGDTVDLNSIAGDTESVYVNVFGSCEAEGQTAYRVMIKNPTVDGESMYAVEVCR